MRKMTKWHRLIIKFRQSFIPDGPHGDRARGRLYEPFLKKYGKNFKVATGAMIYNPNGLSVGDDVYVGFCTYIGQGEVVLEDEVLIGNHVSITASNHLKKDGSFRFGGFKAEPIRIKRGTWIGGHSCIVAGVTVTKGSLVAAGAVVTESLKEDDILVGGIPAKKIKKI